MGAEADDDPDLDDEDAPLLGGARVRQHVDRLTRPNAFRKACFKGLPWVISLCVLQVVLIRAESALNFPYLRSLQSCDAAVRLHDTVAAAAGALDWSGSDHCADRGIVTRLAQAEANYVQGVGMVCHCLCLPFLGWFADRFGRKPVIVITFVGVLVEALLNVWRQRIDVLFVAVAIQMATNGLTPALLAMIADGTPPEERVGAYVLCMAAAVPAYAAVYLGITHFVLAEHLHDYRRTWGGIAALASVGLLVALCTPETLRRAPARATAGDDAASAVETASAPTPGAPNGQATDEYGHEAKRPRGDEPRVCSPLRLLARCCGGLRERAPPAGVAPPAGLCAYCRESLGSLCAPCAIPPLRFVMLMEGPMLIAMAAFSTLDGFALIAYSWEQETMYYVRLVTLPSGCVAILASLLLMRDHSGIGPRRTLQLGLLSLFLALLTMCFAQWHTHLLLLALMLGSGASLGVLPVLRLLSAQVATDQQAAANAAVLAVANGCRALGLALHAKVFQEAAMRGILNAPFALGALAAGLALLVGVLLAPPAEAWRVGAARSPREEARRDSREARRSE